MTVRSARQRISAAFAHHSDTISNREIGLFVDVVMVSGNMIGAAVFRAVFHRVCLFASLNRVSYLAVRSDCFGDAWIAVRK